MKRSVIDDDGLRVYRFHPSKSFISWILTHASYNTRNSTDYDKSTQKVLIMFVYVNTDTITWCSSVCLYKYLYEYSSICKSERNPYSQKLMLNLKTYSIEHTTRNNGQTYRTKRSVVIWKDVIFKHTCIRNTCVNLATHPWTPKNRTGCSRVNILEMYSVRGRLEPGRHIGYRGNIQSLQANSRIVPRFDHHCFLRHYFQLSSHPTIRHYEV
jgi:hypothetical protein